MAPRPFLFLLLLLGTAPRPQPLRGSPQSRPTAVANLRARMVRGNHHAGHVPRVNLLSDGPAAILGRGPAEGGAAP